MIFITIDLTPDWEYMAEKLPFALTRDLEWILHKAFTDFGRIVVKEIRKQLRYHRYTGRLAEAVDFRVQELGTLRLTTREMPKYLEVGLFRETEVVPADIGKSPPSEYWHFIEFGSRPHTRPWGRISAMRVIHWAKAKGIEPLPWKIGGRSKIYPWRHILGGIYKKGTRRMPFLEKALILAELQLERVVERAQDEYWARLARRWWGR